MTHAATAHHTSMGLDSRKMAFWAFIGSECLLFGSLISTYLVYKGRSVVGPYPPDILNIPFTSVSSEGDSAGWEPAQRVLDDGQAGRCIVLPPTESVLRAVTRAGSAREVLDGASARPLTAIVPVVTVDESGNYVIAANDEVFVRPGAGAVR